MGGVLGGNDGIDSGEAILTLSSFLKFCLKLAGLLFYEIAFFRIQHIFVYKNILEEVADNQHGVRYSWVLCFAGSTIVSFCSLV